MSLTKKDFESLAETVKKTMWYLPGAKFGNGDAWKDQTVAKAVVDDLADWCQSQNPRFDREKFLKACGVSE